MSTNYFRHPFYLPSPPPFCSQPQVIGINRLVTRVGDNELGHVALEHMTLRVTERPLLAHDSAFVWKTPQHDLQRGAAVNAAVVPSASLRFSFKSIPLTGLPKPAAHGGNLPAAATVAGEVRAAAQFTMQGLTCYLDPDCGRVAAVVAVTAQVRRDGGRVRREGVVNHSTSFSIPNTPSPTPQP